MTALPKFGLLTNPIVDVIKEIENIARLGFDFVEIGIEWPEGSPDILLKKREGIISLLEKYKIFAIAHTAWWIDIATPYDLVRNAWIEETKKKIRVAHSLGIKLVNFHTHAREMTPLYKKYEKQILKNFCQGLKELVEFGKKYNVEIMLENAGEKGEITDTQLIKQITNTIPDVKIHFDIGHAFIFGGMKNIRSFLTTFGNSIVHIHMHDNHGKTDEHLPIGKGKIDYAKVVKLLKKMKYNKTITFEIFTNKKDAKKSMNKIKKLWMS